MDNSPEAPPIVIALSEFSQYHLDAAQSFVVGRVPITTKPRSTLTFSPFKRLPPEIKLRIWKYFVFSQPRIVQLRRTNINGEEREANESVTIRSISRETRAETFKSFGYVNIDIAPTPTSESTPTFLFNPSLDLLVLCSHEEMQHWESLHDVIKSLFKQNILTKIRSIAIPWDENSMPLLKLLRRCESLELVLLIWRDWEVSSLSDYQIKQGSAFAALDDERRRAGGSGRSRGSWLFLSDGGERKSYIDQNKVLAREMLARRPHGISPQVEFVSARW